MDKISRKTLLYKTAVEYGDYTINHVQGCSHGCKYPCYAFLMAKRFGRVKGYNEWIKPKIVENAPELLKNELLKMNDKIKSIQLCFTTDPFMNGYKEVTQMSLKLIRMINDFNIKSVVLTKGLLPKELCKFNKDNEYGITLISLDDEFRKKYEPYSCNINDRIEALRYLHDKGFYTWVSIEPYPTPNIINQELKDILKSISFVDKIIFGRLNYNKLVSEYKDHNEFYKNQVNNLKEFCSNNNIQYYIKKRNS